MLHTTGGFSCHHSDERGRVRRVGHDAKNKRLEFGKTIKGGGSSVDDAFGKVHEDTT